MNTGSGTALHNVLVRAGLDANERLQLHALRRDDVVDVAQHRRMAVRRIGQLVQREVRRPQLVVDAEIDDLARIVLAAGVQLVDRARIGAGAEVAGRAGD